MSTAENWEITATRPVLIVSDIGRAVEFYTRIGFEEVFRNDIVYSVLRIGEHFIHLGTKMEAEGAGHSMAVIEMRGVDQYYAFCTKQRATIHREPQDRFYGMRDFQVIDPDRNVVTFGEHLKVGGTADEQG